MNNIYKSAFKKIIFIFCFFVFFIFIYNVFGADDLQKGLIAHYPLNGTNTTKDITPNMNNATNNAAVLTVGRKGEASGAYSFNGSTSYIRTGIIPQSNYFSISVWFKTSAVSGNLYWGAGNNKAIIQLLSGNKLSWYVQTTSNTVGYITSVNSYKSGEWNNAILVYNGSQVFLYINGIQDSATGNLTGISASGAINLGTKYDASGAFFNGSITDVRIYNRALSATEIILIYNVYKPIISNDISIQRGLIAYYPLDSVYGTKDATPNMRNGVANGAVLAVDRKGVTNNSYSFNGTSSYISLPNDLGYRTQVSAFAWFKSSGVPAGGYHIIFGGSQLEISIPTAGALRTGVYTNTRFVSNHGSGLTDGNWHFVGFTFDGSKKRSYIDGVFVGEQDVAGSLTYSFANRRIGQFGSDSTYFLNGSLSSVRLYSRAISLAEIKSLYDSYKPKTSVGTLNSGLIFDMPLTNKYTKSATVVSDNTPYANHGIISGATVGATETNFVTSSNLTVSSHRISLTNKFTVSGWFKFNEYSHMTLLNLGGFQFKWRIVGNYPYWNLYNSSGTHLGSLAYNTIPAINTWNHYVFSYDGTTRRIYLNGVLNNSASSTGNVLVNSGFTLATNSGETFKGAMSGIKIYNRSLSNDEIKLLYDKGR